MAYIVPSPTSSLSTHLSFSYFPRRYRAALAAAAGLLVAWMRLPLMGPTWASGRCG